MIIWEVSGSRKRSRFDIVIDILKVTTEGANKTKIVYDANLNFKVANEYIEFLLESGLINQTSKGNRKLYQTTEKGLELLKKYRDIEESVRTMEGIEKKLE